VRRAGRTGYGRAGFGAALSQQGIQVRNSGPSLRLKDGELNLLGFVHLEANRRLGIQRIGRAAQERQRARLLG